MKISHRIVALVASALFVLGCNFVTPITADSINAWNVSALAVPENFAIEGEDLGALKNHAHAMGLTQTQFDRSRADLNRARAQLLETEARLDNKRIEAPFSGTMGIRRVSRTVMAMLVKPNRASNGVQERSASTSVSTPIWQ